MPVPAYAAQVGNTSVNPMLNQINNNNNICCTYHQLKYSYLNHSNKLKTKTRANLSENGGLGKNISQENGPKAEKDKTERATGLGRRTKEEICRKGGIKLTALRLQTKGRHPKSPASLQGMMIQTEGCFPKTTLTCINSSQRGMR